MRTTVKHHFSKDNEYIHYPQEIFFLIMLYFLREEKKASHLISLSNLMKKAWMGTQVMRVSTSTCPESLDAIQ